MSLSFPTGASRLSRTSASSLDVTRRSSSTRAWGRSMGGKCWKPLFASRRARRLILTITHFHPEHGFGAQAFKGAAHITYNRAQRDELQAKGQAYLGMFRTFGPGVAEALSETDIVSARRDL